jgi:hypothetical protein
VLLPWVLTGVFVVTTASHPVGAACSLITATLFTTCVLMLGVFCSLAARQPAGALAPTFIFPVVMIVVTFFVIGLFGEAHCAVLWVGIALAVPLGVFWTRRSLNPASVATRFVSMHLLFCGLATCWAAASDHLEHPLADMHPMYLTMVFLQEEGPFSSRREPDGFTCAALPFYWLGMLANLAWGRAWMIRHFDRIAGRL